MVCLVSYEPMWAEHPYMNDRKKKDLSINQPIIMEQWAQV